MALSEEDQKKWEKLQKVLEDYCVTFGLENAMPDRKVVSDVEAPVAPVDLLDEHGEMNAEAWAEWMDSLDAYYGECRSINKSLQRFTKGLNVDFNQVKEFTQNEENFTPDELQAIRDLEAEVEGSQREALDRTHPDERKKLIQREKKRLKKVKTATTKGRKGWMEA